MKNKVTIGIDLAGKPENPTGWALWKNKRVSTSLLSSDDEILERISHSKPSIIAIDAPFHLPSKGILRRADREMIRHGYRVFPPTLPSMKKLTIRAEKLTEQIVKEGYRVIEVHPTSTRKALSIPLKDWRKIQTILIDIGLEGDLKVRTLTSHEIDAITAALTAYLYTRNQTEAWGDEEEGYIIVPKRQNWRTLRL